MLKRQFRLRQRSDFARLKQVGRVRQTPMLLVSIAPNTLPNNRYGIVTARRIGSAVKRNRVRRLIREALRYRQPQIKSSYDVVIVAKSPIVGQTLMQVIAHLDAVFVLLGLVLKANEA